MTRPSLERYLGRTIDARVEAARRITRAVLDQHPYALCFSCLATDEAISEFEVRQAAQIAVVRDGLRVMRRVCYRCNHTDDTLVAPEP